MTRILLVEDYEILLEMMSKLLLNEHGSVVALASGKEAELALKSQDFDLIILDWELPEVSGIELCRSYRARGGTAPVLMLTAKKDISEKEEAFEAGADDYLTKPFNPRELSARVKALLRRAAASAAAGMMQAAELAAGTFIAGRYEILCLVGHGNMGVVYKARHVVLGRTVALKILQPQLIADEVKRARFQIEARAASTLNHPNVVVVYDFGVAAAGQPYMAMEYLEGATVAQVIRAEGRMEPQRATKVMLQACDALAHAHRQGVIHRDVKPSNLLLVRGGEGELLKIVDFGIAKLLDSEGAQHLTHTGDAIGSPLYMSPEQVMGRKVDARSDIFSLGCVLYESLTGLQPFCGENLMETMFKRLTEKAAPFAEARPDLALPEALERITFTALAKEPEDRFQSMEELKQSLEGIQRDL